LITFTTKRFSFCIFITKSSISKKTSVLALILLPADPCRCGLLIFVVGSLFKHAPVSFLGSEKHSGPWEMGNKNWVGEYE
jgi:hypothetical protein